MPIAISKKNYTWRPVAPEGGQTQKIKEEGD
jgi:hypothetical protein